MKTLISGTNVFYAGGAASRTEVNSAINRSDLLKIKAFFKRRKVKPHTKGDYIAIIAPEDEADLLAEAGNGWVEIAKYAESIGVLGIGLYETDKDGHFVHIDTRTKKSFWYGHKRALCCGPK